MCKRQPEVVHPLGGGEQLPLPGSDVFEPDDVEFYLEGRIEGGRVEGYRSPVRTNWERMRAYRRAQQKAIIGRRRGTDLEIAFIKPFHNEARHTAIFTTRLEAMHGVTFVLLAPGHELIEFVTDPEYLEDLEA